MSEGFNILQSHAESDFSESLSAVDLFFRDGSCRMKNVDNGFYRLCFLTLLTLFPTLGQKKTAFSLRVVVFPVLQQ